MWISIIKCQVFTCVLPLPPVEKTWPTSYCIYLKSIHSFPVHLEQATPFSMGVRVPIRLGSQLWLQLTLLSPLFQKETTGLSFSFPKWKFFSHLKAIAHGVHVHITPFPSLFTALLYVPQACYYETLPCNNPKLFISFHCLYSLCIFEIVEQLLLLLRTDPPVCLLFLPGS